MLDLVDHVADWSRAAPILLVCVARPELLDVRPQLGRRQAERDVDPPRAARRRARCDALADVLLGGRRARRRRRARASWRPPTATRSSSRRWRRSRARPDGTVDVPPTIRALLQARLDSARRRASGPSSSGAAVEGQVFHRGAVTALAPDARAGRRRTARRRSSVRRSSGRTARSIAGDDAFRFRHLLIRDTAYEALPKAVRADAPRALRRWLEANAELVEQDEIVGYHLEQSRVVPYVSWTPTTRRQRRSRDARPASRRGRARGARARATATLRSNLLRRALALAASTASSAGG